MKRPLALFCGIFIIVSLICSLTEVKEAVTLCLSLFVLSLVISLVMIKKSYSFIVVCFSITLALIAFLANYTYRYAKAISYADSAEHTFYVCVKDENTVRVSSADGERVIPFDMTVYFGDQVKVGEYLYIKGEAEEKERSDEIYDDALYNLSENNYLTVPSPEIERTDNINKFLASSDYLRTGIKNRFLSVLDEDTAGKMSGILLGNKNGIGMAQKNKYSAAGISHMFAVSGLHLSVLVGMLIVFLRLFYIKRKPLALILAMAVFFFMWLVGFTPSVVRAGIMTVILCLSFATNRRTDSLTSLCVAGAIICLCGPYAAADCRFLLSFVAVLAIITVSKYFVAFVMRFFEIIKFKNLFTVKLSDVLGISIAVMFATLPVIVICFDAATMLSPITNMLVLWMVSPLLLSAIILLVFRIKPIAFILTLLIKYMDKVVSMVLECDSLNVLVTQRVTFILVAAELVLFMLCRIIGNNFINKAIFAMLVLAVVSTGTSFITTHYDGVTLVQTELRANNCVLVIDDKKAMALIDGKFSHYPEEMVYSICSSLAGHGLYELDKVVINEGSEELTAALEKNIEIKDCYVNEYDVRKIKIGDSDVRLFYIDGNLCAYVSRGDSSFAVINDYDGDIRFYNINDADVLFFAGNCPDVEFAQKENYKFAVAGQVRATEGTKGKILEKFLKNNIYKVEDYGTIEIRTSGNGEYDIKTERDKNADK